MPYYSRIGSKWVEGEYTVPRTQVVFGDHRYQLYYGRVAPSEKIPEGAREVKFLPRGDLEAFFEITGHNY